MPSVTRRHLLMRVTPGLALTALLPACGQREARSAPIRIPQRAASPVGTPAPATPVPPTPTPTLSAAQPVFLGRESCPGFTGRRTVNPDDPYIVGATGELAATPFATRVHRGGYLILVGTVRDILPARWATPDGRRPANPHTEERMLIYTPIRVQVERLAKGEYALPDLYFAEPGGQIGQDCASYGGSGRWPSFFFGARYLYFAASSSLTTASPVPGDDRYRFHSATASYGISASGTLTIGPERDIMGNTADDPPRTLTVDEVFREIATILGIHPATPTR